MARTFDFSTIEAATVVADEYKRLNYCAKVVITKKGYAVEYEAPSAYTKAKLEHERRRRR